MKNETERGRERGITHKICCQDSKVQTYILIQHTHLNSHVGGGESQMDTPADVIPEYEKYVPIGIKTKLPKTSSQKALLFNAIFLGVVG